MSLSIDRIELSQFRSYDHFETEFNPGISVVVGPNAVGKTNLVEAIQLTTTTESFRRPRPFDLVRQGQAAAKVSMWAAGEDDRLDVVMSVEGNRRTYEINGKKKAPKELLGRLPCVVFTPDDLFMVKGPAEERRRTVDEAGVQLSAGYAHLRAEYSRVLRQRNAALKSHPDPTQMEALDQQLMELGTRLFEHRRGLTEKLSERAGQLYEAMADQESLQVRIVPSWERAGTEAGEGETQTVFARALADSKRIETARATTIIGPHRDDLLFTVASRDARTHASQGQQRTAALAWKLAEVGLIEEITGKKPLVLLDDVMSELDKRRREALTGVLSQTNQTIITTTNLQYFDEDVLSEASILELS